MREGVQMKRKTKPVDKKPPRPMSKSAVKRLFAMTDRLHAVSHAFHKARRSWPVKGYDLMEKAEKWAENRRGIQVVRVDDDHHTNSDLVLIRHSTGKHYMGISVMFIPQCSGEMPTTFFLYPRAARSLIKALHVWNADRKERYE